MVVRVKGMGIFGWNVLVRCIGCDWRLFGVSERVGFVVIGFL